MESLIMHRTLQLSPQRFTGGTYKSLLFLSSTGGQSSRGLRHTWHRNSHATGELSATSSNALTKNTEADHSKDFRLAQQLLPCTEHTSNEEERMETLIKEIKQMFQSMDDGATSPSAYDTAWVARIPAVGNGGRPQFPTTLEWILSNQNEDGSWGEPRFFLLYDRLICTLACVLTLIKWRRGADLVDKGLNFLQERIRELEGEALGLRTCGFEIIFPSMLKEAEGLKLDLPYDVPYLKEISSMRDHKIKRLPVDVMHSIHTTLLYSLEALEEVVDWERILKLQSSDGSFLSSPSSTAFAYIKSGDKKCLDYLTYIVNKFGDHAPAQYPIDLFDRIWVVDTIQRLGIDRHFRNEITNALDYVHRNLRKGGVSWGRDNPVADVDDTSMAFRLLRMHGYPVSADVLENFKDHNGNFFCFAGQTHLGLSDMFNMYRFAQVSFPGEKILKEARAFAEGHLRTCLKQNHMHDKWSLKKALHKEVENALRFPWMMSLPRLEAREYMSNYGENDVWISKTLYLMCNVNQPKYLELAKLDYKQLQIMYPSEMNTLHRWWKNCSIKDYFLGQSCLEKLYCTIAAAMYEPEFSACRVAYAKCNFIEDALKDIFRSHASVDDLIVVCQAVKNWDPALVKHLPREVKAAFWVMYDSLNDLATLATEVQGRNMFPYIHNLRAKQVQDYLEHREVGASRQFTSWSEHMDWGKRELAINMRVLLPMMLIGEHLPDHILRQLDCRSKIFSQIALFLKLITDLQCPDRERLIASEPFILESLVNYSAHSSLGACMKKEKWSEQGVANFLNETTENAFDELTHEYLKPSQVPHSCRRLLFEHARVTQFLSNRGDDQNNITRAAILDSLFAPIE